MCAIFLSHFVFAVFWRTLVAFGFIFHHDWFCRLYSVQITPLPENFDRSHSGCDRGVLEVVLDRPVCVVLNIKVQAVVLSVVLQVADVHQHIQSVGRENLPDVPVPVHLHLRVPDVWAIGHPDNFQPSGVFAEQWLEQERVFGLDSL